MKIQFDHIYEALMELAIVKPASKKLFGEWERLHLRDLTTANKGYKLSSKASFKAKVLNSLPDSTKLSLFEKLAPALNLETVPTKEQLSDFRGSLASDLIFSETAHTINEHPLRFLALYPGLLNNLFNDLAEIDYAQKSQEFAGIELVKVSDVAEPETPVPAESVETSVADAAIKLLELALERSELEGLDNSGVNFARAVAAIFQQSTALGQLVMNALTVDTDTETIRALRDEIDYQLSETVPVGLDTYRVVLTDIFELPNNAGYAGKVCAVETAAGKLIPISEGAAFETFPTRGGVYIPMSAIAATAARSNYLPIVAVKSSHEGANRYRMKSLWADLDQIINLQHGLERYDDLVEEIKSLSLPDNRITTWFRLKDGSLITPVSQRSTFTLQVFNEKWRYIAAEEALEISTVCGLAPSSIFNTATSVSMVSNAQVLTEIERLTSEDLPLPDYLMPRLNGVTTSLKSLVGLDEFTRDLIVALKNKEPLASEYKTLLEEEIRRNAPELEGLKTQIEDKKSELKELEVKLSAAEGRLNGVESSLQSKAGEMVRKFKTDLRPILDDPLLLAFINEFRGEQAAPTPQNQAASSAAVSAVEPVQKGPATVVHFKAEQQKTLLRGLGIRSWSDDSVAKLTEAAHELMSTGLTLEIHGENGFQLAHMILGHFGEGKYETIVTTFAENIEYACSRILEIGNTATLITGVEERHIGLFRSALQFRAEVLSSDCAPVIFVTGHRCMEELNTVITLSPSQLGNISAEGEYDEEDFEADLSGLGPYFRKYIKGMQPSGFLDLIYTSNNATPDKSG